MEIYFCGGFRSLLFVVTNKVHYSLNNVFLASAPSKDGRLSVRIVHYQGESSKEENTKAPPAKSFSS